MATRTSSRVRVVPERLIDTVAFATTYSKPVPTPDLDMLTTEVVNPTKLYKGSANVVKLIKKVSVNTGRTYTVPHTRTPKGLQRKMSVRWTDPQRYTLAVACATFINPITRKPTWSRIEDLARCGTIPELQDKVPLHPCPNNHGHLQKQWKRMQIMKSSLPAHIQSVM